MQGSDRLVDIEKDGRQKCEAVLFHNHFNRRGVTFIGGAPLPGTPANEECRKRSASSCLASPLPFMLDINGGLFDGREGSVPFTHSLKAFNAAAKAEDRIPEADIAAFYETQQAPYPTDCANLKSHKNTYLCDFLTPKHYICVIYVDFLYKSVYNAII